MEEKVEQIFDVTLGIKTGTGKMVFQTCETKGQISKDLCDCLGVINTSHKSAFL